MTIDKPVRPNYIDWAKFITMLLVVYGHYVPFSGLQMGDNNLWHIVHVINIFHMPLFFFISGMLFSKKDNEVFYTSIRKTLLEPYILISVICLALGSFFYIIAHQFTFKFLDKEIIGILSGGDMFGYGNLTFSGPLWFCYSLILIKLIAHFSVDSWKKMTIVTVIAILSFYIGDRLPFRIDSSLVSFLFFISGYYSKKYVTIILNDKYCLFACFVVGAIFVLIEAYYNIDFTSEQPLSINAMYFGRYPLLFYIGAMGGVYCILALASVLARFKPNFVLTCSNGMIVILGFQCFLFFILSRIIEPQYSFFMSIFDSLVVYVGCYCLILFSSRYAPALLGYRKV